LSRALIRRDVESSAFDPRYLSSSDTKRSPDTWASLLLLHCTWLLRAMALLGAMSSEDMDRQLSAQDN
jgi:hypothetical protein